MDFSIEQPRREEKFVVFSSPLLDIPSPLSYDDNVTTDALIAELRAKVDYHRSKLRIWENALKSALEEKSGSDGRLPGKASAKPASQETRGKVSRAFVREVLKRNAKTGVTPKQIREAAEQQGLTYTENFPHTVLHKFRTQAKPEVREEGGRYFPIPPEQ